MKIHNVSSMFCPRVSPTMKIFLCNNHQCDVTTYNYCCKEIGLIFWLLCSFLEDLMENSTVDLTGKKRKTPIFQKKMRRNSMVFWIAARLVILVFVKCRIWKNSIMKIKDLLSKKIFFWRFLNPNISHIHNNFNVGSFFQAFNDQNLLV